MRAHEHVGAWDDGCLHAHHDELLQLNVLDHVGVQVGVDESHTWSFRVMRGPFGSCGRRGFGDGFLLGEGPLPVGRPAGDGEDGGAGGGPHEARAM